MTKKLHNSFIEFLLVIGFDQETGLSTPESSNQKNQNDIFSVNFEPSVLATISSENALYPRRYIKYNILYPPPNLKRTLSSEVGDNSVDNELNTKKLVRRQTIKPTEKTASLEVLDNMPQFCFPDGAYISKKPMEPEISSFLLTDIEGNKTHGMVLKYYREFYCCLNEGDIDLKYDLIEINDDNDETEEKKDYFLIYAPISILLLSKYSYYNVFKDCLTCIHSALCKEPNHFQTIIETFAYKMTNFLVPPPIVQRFGLTLEYNLDNKSIQIFPAEEPGYNVFDLNLSLIFKKFDFDTVIQIVLCILSEQKIVFVSKSYNILTPIIECFMKLIHPFKWQPTYVPLLPSSKIDFIEAPTPFIMGYNSSYKDQLAKSEEVVLIDIDFGTVKIPESLNLIQFPVPHVNLLKNKFKQIDLNSLEIKKLTSLSCLNYNDYIQFENTINQNLNSEILQLFLEFYVNIFDDIYSCIKIQGKSFNKKRYLEMQSENYRPFYEQVTNTFIFDFFINERIQNYNLQISDSYFKLLEQIKLNSSIYANSLTSNLTSTFDSNFEIKESKALNYIKPIKKTLKMPKFEGNNDGYHRSCLKLFKDQLENSTSLIYRDCLNYLCGLLNLYMGKIKDGFENLFAIESVEIFPKSLVENIIIPSLASIQKEMLFEQQFYISAPAWKKFESNNAFVQSMSVDLSDNTFGEYNDLDMTEFVEKLEQLDIRIDNETARRLYNALTIQTSKLEILTFQLFIDYWYLREDELLKIHKYFPRNRLRLKEFALKISIHTVVSNHGIGRIVLSQKSLYHLEQGTNKVTKLIDLKQIKSIEKVEVPNKKNNLEKQALKIVSKEDETHQLCLTNERNLWYLLVREIWSATLLYEESKDPLIVQSAALNVKLLNAVVGCANDTDAVYSFDLQPVADCLCYYTYVLTYDDGRLEEENTHILHLRINPSGRNFERNSVESIICVDSDDYQSVWCAVGTRIKIFDSTSWSYETSDIKLKDRITCMVHEPNQSKIWVGAMDKCLYVIDIQTRSFERKLDGHIEIVVAIEIVNQNYIISATSNGEIIFWDVKKFEIFKTLKLNDAVADFKKIIINLKFAFDKIICTTADQILILNSNFEFEMKLVLETTDPSSLSPFTGQGLPTLKTKILPISCSCISENENQKLIWVGCASNGFIYVWNLDTYEQVVILPVEDSLGCRSILYAHNMIWAGSKNGKLSIFSVKTYNHEKTLSAHKDTIRSLCLVNERFVVSGSGSKDGTIAIWKAVNLPRQKSITSTMRRLLETQDVRRASIPIKATLLK